MILNIFLLIFGFIILIKGADVFVDGASSIAGNFKLSKMLIGLTIVSFGTSAPELAVSIKSIISGNHDMVLGNVIGSNILNILLILGVSSLFHSLNVKSATVQKEIPITILITVLFSVLLSDKLINGEGVSSFTRVDGIVLVLFFTVFIYYLLTMMRNKHENEEDDEYLSLGKAFIYTIAGIGFIVLGSNFVVDSASYIATAFGVSQKLISLTIIALGTSLPELATSVQATRKGEYDIAIGNVVGSNIFNIGLVIGLPITIFGGINSINFNFIDLFTLVIATVLLFIFSLNDKKITKKEGLFFLLVFAIYYANVIITG